MAGFVRSVKRNIIKGYMKRKGYNKVNRRVMSVWSHLKGDDIPEMAKALKASK